MENEAVQGHSQVDAAATRAEAFDPRAQHVRRSHCETSDQTRQDSHRLARNEGESPMVLTKLADEPDESSHTFTGPIYHNNLLWAVGLLEWSNAMDFPANIFNQLPIPVFAQVLMGIGGSIAILWSIFPLLDMLRSMKNVQVLRQERRFLKSWQQRFDSEDSLETRCLVQALLDVDFRELGWELVDRILMDVCAGTSGVLVGTGALMAIRGDIDTVFTTSNLLSGYIGNSFLAPFALTNAVWATFMWRRASVEHKLVDDDDIKMSELLQRDLASHARKHRFYAVLNGITAVVGTVGSIMSSTLWYGYVVIAPCVFTLLFCNLYWRSQLGYTRSTVSSKTDLRTFDLERALKAIMTIDAIVDSDTRREKSANTLAPLQAALRYLRDLSDDDVYRRDVASDDGAEENLEEKHEAGNRSVSLTIQQRKRLQYRKRHFLELHGRYIRALQQCDDEKPPEG